MRRSRLPPVLVLSPFSVHDADAEGVSRSRLRAHDLIVPFRGIRAHRPAAASATDRCRQIAPLLGRHQFFSHESAAALWGLWMPRPSAIDVHVSAISPRHAPRMRGVTAHHLREERVDRIVLDGMPVTTPAETWRHLSPNLTVDQLVAVGDCLLRRQNPLCTRPQLVRALARHGGQRGVVKLRDAFALVRGNTDSPRETQLRLLLVRAGLPQPEVNGVILLGDGTSTHGDLVYRDARVLVEYDGHQHTDDRRQFARDVTRLELLADERWRIIRVLAAHLEQPESVIRRVRSALAAASMSAEMPSTDS